MGVDFTTTEDMVGAIFIGAGGSMPVVWTIVGALICVYAIWVGNRHEHAAYKKLKK